VLPMDLGKNPVSLAEFFCWCQMPPAIGNRVYTNNVRLRGLREEFIGLLRFTRNGILMYFTAHLFMQKMEPSPAIPQLRKVGVEELQIQHP
jgi:hypothetical protein